MSSGSASGTKYRPSNRVDKSGLIKKPTLSLDAFIVAIYVFSIVRGLLLHHSSYEMGERGFSKLDRFFVDCHRYWMTTVSYKKILLF